MGKDNSSGKVSAYNIMAVSNLAVEEGKLSATSRPVPKTSGSSMSFSKARLSLGIGESECVYSLPVYSLEEAASNLLNIQRGVKILHPEELRGIYLAKARAMAGAIAKKNKK